MPDDVTVTVVNGARVDAMWRGVTADLEHLGDPLARALGVALDAAAQSAPRRSGLLAGSHGVTASGANRARMVNTAPYAGFVHSGTRYLQGRPWLARALESTQSRWTADLSAQVQAGLDARAAST